MTQCSHCGRDLTTDDGHISPNDLPYCFDCYLDADLDFREIRLQTTEHETLVEVETDSPFGSGLRRERFTDRDTADRFRQALSQKIRYVLLISLTTDDNYILVGCPNEPDAAQIEAAVHESPLASWIADTEIHWLADVYERGGPVSYRDYPLFSKLYCWRLSLWKGGGTHGIAASGSRLVYEVDGIYCVVNSTKAVSGETREAIVSDLVETFVEEEGFERVEVVGDVRRLARETLSVALHFFPEATQLLEKYVRENPEILSEHSRRMIEANEKGQEFEEFFAETCADFGLTCERSSSIYHLVSQWEAFTAGELSYELSEARQAEVLRLPARVREGFASLDRGTGLPDYVVWGDEEVVSAFIDEYGEGGVAESPQEVVFVEVKYMSHPRLPPTLTDRQEEMIPTLKANGHTVYFFKGTFDQYWLEQAET